MAIKYAFTHDIAIFGIQFFTRGVQIADAVLAVYENNRRCQTIENSQVNIGIVHIFPFYIHLYC
jgi:hypothetical protein